MASRDIDLLDRDFRSGIRSIISAAADNGFTVVPFSTLVTPAEQAAMWRATRGKSEIMAAARELESAGARRLARLLSDAGPSYPPPGTRGHITSALPGYSWHNHGLACDLYVLDGDGRAVWDESDAHVEALGDLAKDAGLVSGLKWRSREKWPYHVQRDRKQPGDAMPALDIEARMIAMHGEF